MLKRAATDDTLETEAPAHEKRRQQELLAEAHRVYDRYVKPLEQEHWGEYVFVAADGRSVLGASELDAIDKGIAALGRGHFLFKVGDIAVGKIR
jgi:hypothetical protein